MTCEVCGKVKVVRHADIKTFRACSKRCASEISRRAMPRTSSLEVVMAQAFTDHGIAVQPQYAISHYTVDFAIPELKLIIECDGTYWHGLHRQQVRDKHKDAWLSRRGWAIVRLPETLIRASVSECIDLVTAAMYSAFLAHPWQ